MVLKTEDRYKIEGHETIAFLQQILGTYICSDEEQRKQVREFKYFKVMLGIEAQVGIF